MLSKYPNRCAEPSDGETMDGNASDKYLIVRGISPADVWHIPAEEWDILDNGMLCLYGSDGCHVANFAPGCWSSIRRVG